MKKKHPRPTSPFQEKPPAPPEASFSPAGDEVESLYPELSPAEPDPEEGTRPAETESQAPVSPKQKKQKKQTEQRAKKAWFSPRKRELSPKQAEKASKDAVYVRELRRKKRRFRLSWRSSFWGRSFRRVHLRSLALLSLLLFLLATIALLPPFYAKTFRISGLRHLDTYRLIEASGLHPGQHLIRGMGGSLESWLRLRYGGAEERIRQALPLVEEVVVKPDFPGAISIQVTERIGVAYVKMSEGVLVVDREGVILRVAEKAPENLPLIEGLEEERIETGKPVHEAFRNALSGSVMILSLIIDTDKNADDGWSFLSRVVSLRPVDAATHFLTLRREGREGEEGGLLQVKMGSVSNLKDNLNWLRAATKLGEIDRLSEGLLDLSGKHKVFRPMAEFEVQPKLPKPETFDQDLSQEAPQEGEAEQKAKTAQPSGTDPAKEEPALPPSGPALPAPSMTEVAPGERTKPSLQPIQPVVETARAQPTASQRPAQETFPVFKP